MSASAIKLRRRFYDIIKEEKVLTCQGENTVSFVASTGARLNSLTLTAKGKNQETGRKLVIRGKNLFNPTREFQSGMTYINKIETLREGIASGQMLFFSISHTSDGIKCGVANQYHIIIPITNGKTYTVTGYIKTEGRILDENLTFIKKASNYTGAGISTTFVNDVNGKYLMYYTFNHVQGTAVQNWTLDDVLTKTQIETGEVATEYEPYVTPSVSVIPEKTNGEEGVSLAFNEGDTLKVDYKSRKVTYNGTDITGHDFSQYLLGLTCVAKTNIIETEGVNCDIEVKYYE